MPTAAPPHLHVLTFYDPFVFAIPDENFFADFNEYDGAVDRELFQRFWRSGAIRGLYTTSDSAVPVLLLGRNAEGRSLGAGRLWWLREITGGDDGLRAALLGAARFEYLSTYFIVEGDSQPLTGALAMWRMESQAPASSVWARTYKLPVPLLPAERWQELERVLEQLEGRNLLVSFGNEGTMLMALSRNPLAAFADAVRELQAPR